MPERKISLSFGVVTNEAHKSFPHLIPLHFCHSNNNTQQFAEYKTKTKEGKNKMMVPNKVDLLIAENKELKKRIASLEQRIERHYKTLSNLKHSFDILSNKLKEITIPITISNKQIELPEHLYKTMATVKRLNKRVSASEVSDITGNTRPTESSYLHQLVHLRILTKTKVGSKVFFTLIENNQFMEETETYDL